MIISVEVNYFVYYSYTVNSCDVTKLVRYIYKKCIELVKNASIPLVKSDLQIGCMFVLLVAICAFVILL